MGFDLGNMTFRKKDSCIYGASIGGNKIIKITSTGEVSIFAGSTAGYQDGDISVAQFNKPLGIAFSFTEDTLYVSEGGNVNRLRRIIMNQSVNINQSASREINLYPNPANGLVHIKIQPNDEISKVVVKDLNGKIVYAENVYETLSNRKTIDLSILSDGMYFLQLINANEKDYFTSKIVIQHN